MKYAFFLVSFFCVLSSCDEKLEKDLSSTEYQSPFPNNPEELIEEGFQSFEPKDFLNDFLLISKKGALKGYSSLNIAGFRLYELNSEGSVSATYDISNNYSIYTYDEQNRLIKAQNKIHSPPSIYFESEYFYKENSDSLLKRVRRHYEKNKVRNEEVDDDIDSINKSLTHQPFLNKLKKEYYIHQEKNHICSFGKDLVFCCGRQMNGNNLLTYHLNDDELIDSLVIQNLEEEKKMVFVYEYDSKKR